MHTCRIMSTLLNIPPWCLMCIYHCTHDLTQIFESNMYEKKSQSSILFSFPHRLCAPIASLDCMEEFTSATGLDLSTGNFIIVFNAGILNSRK